MLTRGAIRQLAKRAVLRVPPLRRLYERRRERFLARLGVPISRSGSALPNGITAPRIASSIGAGHAGIERPAPPSNEVLFKVPVRDLGDVEGKEFAGILIPVPEIGVERKGIDHTFLEDAEDYFCRYQSFDYWRRLIVEASRKIGIADPELVVEFGSGFGNSTLPMLDLFPRVHVIATDLSPNLLAILRRLLDARSVADRCSLVAMDAHRDYISTGTADLVIGSAILHHLVDPALFVERAMALLKPGGCAVFFEPMEAGNAILRLACLQVASESKRRGERSAGLKWLDSMRKQLEPQLFRERLCGWRERNDKWVFPRSVLDDIRRRVGASDLIVYPLHDNERPFTRHVQYVLKAYGGLDSASLPGWAWQIFDEFDRVHFSPELLTDLALEGCIIYRK
jgi:SAM-dependent methyltransferase